MSAPTYEEYNLRLPHRDCPSTWPRRLEERRGEYGLHGVRPHSDEALAEAERRAGDLKLAD